jgi:hypothetical protein
MKYVTKALEDGTYEVVDDKSSESLICSLAELKEQGVLGYSDKGVRVFSSCEEFKKAYNKVQCARDSLINADLFKVSYDSDTDTYSLIWVNKEVKTFKIPEYVNVIEEKAFQNCTKLREISIPNNVRKLGRTCFAVCSSLVSVSINSRLPEIPDCAFHSCRSLRRVTMRYQVTRVGSWAFGDCWELRALDFPYGLSVIEFEAFENCYSLLEIRFPASVKEISQSAFVGASLFRACVQRGSYAHKFFSRKANMVVYY